MVAEDICHSVSIDRPRRMGPCFRRDDTPKWVAAGIKLDYCRSIVVTIRLDRMTALSLEHLTKFVRGISLRQVRLGCGLVLFAYLVSHFLNHALGNISMDALAAGLYYHTLFWQLLPVAIAFYTAALVHAGLGIWALYERRQFRWKAIEPLQLVLGLSIPALVITHIAGVQLGH